MGFLTAKKKILSVFNENKQLIGFSVLTYKRGGSVKTGPTMFFESHRANGYGQIFRHALDKRLRQEKQRKVYCTSTVTNREVIGYLLRSDYRIECQLQSHYGMFDELVFGKLLAPETKLPLDYKFPAATRAPSCLIHHDPSEFEKHLAVFMQREFSRDIAQIDLKIAKNFIKDACRKIDLTYEEKPKKLIFATLSSSVSILCICLPKRGGALKSVLLSSISCSNAVSKVVLAVEKYARSEGRHKLYFTVPEFRQDLTITLKDLGYRTEGILRSPYKKSVDIFLMAKFL